MANTFLQIEAILDNAVGTPKLYLYNRETKTAVGNAAGYAITTTTSYLHEISVPEADGVDAEHVYGELRDDEKLLAYGYAYAVAGDYKQLGAQSSEDIAAQVNLDSDASASDVNIVFSIPGYPVVVNSDGDATIYIKEANVTVTLEATLNGSPYDISGETLVVILEDDDNVDIAVIPDASLTKVVDEVTFTLPSNLTDSVRTVNWALRDATSKRVFGKGSFSVVYAPHEDA